MSEQGKRSFRIKHTMKASDMLGCYYCLRVFSGKTEIPEWADGGETPICPYCGIDSVIVHEPKKDGDLENFKRVLARYNKESFGR